MNESKELEDIGERPERLRLPESDTTVLPQNRCLLFKIPSELRNRIYEDVLLRQPPVITVELGRHRTEKTNASESTFAVIMTCKRIHDECANLLYDVNSVHITAPIFHFHGLFSGPGPVTIGTTHRDEIATKLRTIADRQARLHQMSNAVVHLGELPPLQSLRWTAFFGSWWSVHDILMSLRSNVPRLEVSINLAVPNNRRTKVRFGLATAAEISVGFHSAALAYKDAKEATDVELDKLRKIETTMIKTLFPP